MVQFIIFIAIVFILIGYMYVTKRNTLSNYTNSGDGGTNSEKSQDGNDKNVQDKEQDDRNNSI